jgi:tetratricopeptide (TPR) repeat protein
MNNNLQIENLLDDLLKNNISKTEAVASLKKENIVDTDTQIDLHFAAAKSLQRYNILKQVQLVHNEYIAAKVKPAANNNTNIPKATVIKMKSIKWILQIAASILLLLGAWFTWQYTNTTSSKLYSEIYQPYSVKTDRGIGEIKTHNMVPAFKDKNYEEVIKIFETLLTTNNREKFLTAYSYHETGNYKKSLAIFQEVLAYNKQNNTKLYNDEAEFYSGLAYLKLNDNKSALLIFESIRNNPNHTFYERINKWTLTKLKWLK